MSDELFLMFLLKHLMSRLFLVVLFLLNVSGCASTVQPQAVPKPTIPKTEAECTARGGNWTVLGLPGRQEPKVCDLKASDSGKICTDSAECEGMCMAPTDARVGKRSVGQCSPYLLNFGNIRRLNGGVVEALNID